jgi:hypothetical protein
MSVQQLWMYIRIATGSTCIYRAYLHPSLSLAYILALTQDLKERSAAPRLCSICFLKSVVVTALVAPEICLLKRSIGRIAFTEAMFQDLDSIIQPAENTVLSVKGIDVADTCQL